MRRSLESFDTQKLAPFANLTDQKIAEVIVYLGVVVDDVDDATVVKMFNRAIANRDRARQRIAKLEVHQ
jgi:hypothetical protein